MICHACSSARSPSFRSSRKYYKVASRDPIPCKHHEIRYVLAVPEEVSDIPGVEIGGQIYEALMAESFVQISFIDFKSILLIDTTLLRGLHL